MYVIYATQGSQLRLLILFSGGFFSGGLNRWLRKGQIAEQAQQESIGLIVKNIGQSCHPKKKGAKWKRMQQIENNLPYTFNRLASRNHIIRNSIVTVIGEVDVRSSNGSRSACAPPGT